MSLKRRIWLWLCVLLGLILAADLSFSYVKLKSELRAETEADARVVYGIMMATRHIYQEQFVASGLPLTSKTVGFLPAHSFSRIAKDFAHWNDSGLLFNNVSDQPRNPENQADAEKHASFEDIAETVADDDDISDDDIDDIEEEKASLFAKWKHNRQAQVLDDEDYEEEETPEAKAKREADEKEAAEKEAKRKAKEEEDKRLDAEMNEMMGGFNDVRR